MKETGSLAQAARDVLLCGDARAKAALAREVAAKWRAGGLEADGAVAMPERPNRPEKPELLLPRDMPRRSFKGERGRIALLHSIAHIELNAIDLAFDMAGRFQQADLPRSFFDDWIGVGDDEARHFTMLEERLTALGARYGDLPAHDGLWQAAEGTAHDLLARLAVVPMVLEARGLDVTPAMIERLTRAGDKASADVLDTIYTEEQRHVAAGARWFHHVCAARGMEPRQTFHVLVKRHFRGALKPPFNAQARSAAGLEPDFYEPLAG
ncbi:ferritin-like domain-containing protein [Parvibaculum sp.]|jgi:uncharacterized ferritin-like protein (DUF455 family)|uniref:ferritin-like domain-containing protein n=1 Tax=Parvibaculum sp. TaxID=2024848 RepID=UPI000C4E295F|nr:ferritin-like domain-containing protein [Parvibaculum sp.]MAM96136.1 rhamnosyltransferase [Parvibaculum sp.]HCX69135.1 DUF455 domain-containing protein [Rhodobiaceae bacterium]|tara:strand:+ start:26690 stop:27490 length:801 start_codon:yes stop_codon:yes gene_type:complete